MFSAFLRTMPGSAFVEFMRSERGKKLDKFLVHYFNFSLLMLTFSSRGGFPYIPVLMLYTKGSKSGVLRSTVMPYFRFEGRIYVIGSNGAKAKDPAWVSNLRADPKATIRVNRRLRAVTARVLSVDSEERARAWAHAATKTYQYNRYQSQTDREIPVVALDDAD